jgi:Rrf2 family protein
MRLELGRRADYAIRATLRLARSVDEGGRLKSRAIAEDMAIPVSYVPQILAELVRAGIAESAPGPEGGYRLAVAPGAVTLAAVVDAVEVDAGAAICILRGGPCRWDDMCAVHVPWMQVQEATMATLAATTFADLVVIDGQLEAGTYVLPPELQGGRRPAGGGPAGGGPAGGGPAGGGPAGGGPAGAGDRSGAAPLPSDQGRPASR